jgi:hypothetical protein
VISVISASKTPNLSSRFRRAGAAETVVEIVPVRVVEIVPAAVVEIVPVRVVEIVPVLVVEIVPLFARVGTEITAMTIAEQTSVLKALMASLLVC